MCLLCSVFFFFFQAEDGIRDLTVTGVQTCALPILVCLHLRDAVAAGVVAPDAVFGEAYAVVFPALHGALPLACKVAQAHEVEVGVPPVGVDLGGPVVLGVRLARCAGCTGCWQAVACGVELPAGGGLGVLAVGGLYPLAG